MDAINLNKETERVFKEFFKKNAPDPYDPTKLRFIRDEYWNHHETIVDSTGKRWTDVTTDFCPR